MLVIDKTLQTFSKYSITLAGEAGNRESVNEVTGRVEFSMPDT
jgi:hypothetical protein